jgi:DNA-binding LacI/PurR family transcriptional regulator
MPQITVYDVANQAGVSIATVSRVLNAPEKVSDSTRTRVLSAIDMLGFVPKAEAAARARKGHGRIGVLAPFFTYPSFVQRLRGVANALADSPCELVIYNVDSSVRLVGYLASLPLTRRLDGLIVMALPFDDVAADRLIANHLPTVLVEFSRDPFPSIRIDDRAGGRLAAEYLISKGRCRYAFVGDANVPDYALPTSDWRLDGYRETLAAAGLELPPAYIALAPHSMQNAQRSAYQLFDLPHPPDAIFAASDSQAMGVLKAARERGLAIPDELAVVGFDDVEIADYIGLTTIRQPLEESGRVAVDLLQGQLADPARSVQRVRLSLTLIQRETA